MSFVRERIMHRSSFALACALSSVALAQATDPTLFVANNVGDNIKSFKVNPDGTLTGIGTFATGDGPQTISLSPNGQFMAVAHGTSSTTTEELRIYEVSASGSLTPRFTTTVPDSPLDCLWVSNTALAVTKTGAPAAVRVFDWNTAANSLTQIDIEPTGSFNSNLSTNGAFLYANDSTGGQIRAFTVNPSGTLDLIESQATSPFIAVATSITPDNRFLYGGGGISGDGNRILGYSIAPNGALDPTVPGDFTSPGESPKNFAFSEDSKYMFVGHGTDATIRSLLIDNGTGALTDTGFSYDVGLQGTLGETALLGNYLFATDNSTATDGRSGVISLLIGANGSLTEVGIFASDGARPDYLQVWRGVPEPTTMGVLICAMIGMTSRARRRA